MKQEYGSNNCLAFAAAMAFNSSVEGIESQIPLTPFAKGGLDMQDIIRFGLLKGYYTGAIFIEPKIYFGKIIQPFDIKDSRAIVIVKSNYNADETHAVYWDGKMIWDPDPGVDDGLELSSYEILAWYPVTKI